jgi:TetR/AcrR family transcriptional regulator, fatty acid metabolism regulator protein
MAYRQTPKMAARKLARRTRLLETATRLFGQHGYHATTVPMIVAAAGSSTGSFYSYFRNKEDVCGACLDSLGDRVAEVVEKTKSEHQDPVVQIWFAVEKLFLFLAAHPREARLLIVESSGLGPHLEKIRRKILNRHAEGVRQTLEQGVELAAGFDAAIASHCLVGAVLESLYHWFDTSPRRRTPAAAAARAVAEFAVRGLGTTIAARLDAAR